ncbi:type I restriction endonuclease [Bacteroides thetaiotaomicron]|uniref:type I restriction endonuclease n=1 Tax=Bacteroides thetaiotaomicron TaxID=818 RepID=UPI0039C35E9E
MDFKDQILQLSDRIKKQKDSISTEEATKNAFIMPLIASLGYDVFNPFEVVPEMDCDLIKKKGEKIDYAIMKDENPILLIECKHCKQDLNLHDTQLQKYFVASKSRFGVLTNGIEYRFYTDLEKVNIMDERPFLVVNMLDLSDADIEQLKKFHKSYYNENNVLSTANELKYTTEIKEIFNKEIQSPTSDFVRFFAKQIYTTGQITQKVVEMFTPLVKKSMSMVINDIITERLNTAMKNDEQVEDTTNISSNLPNSPKENTENKLPEGIVYMDKEAGIITTQEEMDAYNIVRSILRRSVDASRITYKDYKTYFVISLDNSQWYWICRISIGARKKQIGIPVNKYKSCDWIQIDSIDDIFKYADRLEESIKMAIEKL